MDIKKFVDVLDTSYDYRINIMLGDWYGIMIM